MESRIHYVSSDTAISGTAGDFRHRLYVPTSHDRVTLISAQIPKTFYQITESTRRYALSSDAKTDDPPVAVAVGNYSANTIAAQLTGLSAVFTASTSKFSFTPTKRYIKFYDARLPRLLGFPYLGKTFPYYFDLTAAENVAPNCANMTIANSLWICCDAVQDLSNAPFGSVLSHFFVNDYPDQAYITYQNVCPLETQKPLAIPAQRSSAELAVPFTVWDFRFSIFDDAGTPVDFNGIDVELIVQTSSSRDLFNLCEKFFRSQIAIEHAKMSAKYT